MVAFNFQNRFVQDILSGKKQSTIRQSQRCKVGDMMQLYTGQRTKNCTKIADAVCTGIAYIQITEKCPWAMSSLVGDVWTYEKSGVPFHEYEGFANCALFVDFFRKQYGLPFSGYVHYFKIKETL